MLVVVNLTGDVVAELFPCLWPLMIFIASRSEYLCRGEPAWFGLSRLTSLLTFAVATLRLFRADPHSGPVEGRPAMLALRVKNSVSNVCTL